VAVTPALSCAADGVNVLRVRLGSHAGTHVDAPFHVRDDLPRLDELPLDRFAGPAVLVDARGLPPRTAVGPEALDPVAGRLGPGVVVLLVTGWSRHWGTGAYLAHPWPTPAFAARLLDAGVRTLGVDTASVDVVPPAGGAGAGLPTHGLLAAAGAVIVENLTGLDALLAARHRGDRVEVTLFPLNLSGADGAPVRAVARVTPAGVRPPDQASDPEPAASR